MPDINKLEEGSISQRELPSLGYAVLHKYLKDGRHTHYSIPKVLPWAEINWAFSLIMPIADFCRYNAAHYKNERLRNVLFIDVSESFIEVSGGFEPPWKVLQTSA